MEGAPITPIAMRSLGTNGISSTPDALHAAGGLLNASPGAAANALVAQGKSFTDVVMMYNDMVGRGMLESS